MYKYLNLLSKIIYIMKVFKEELKNGLEIQELVLPIIKNILKEILKILMVNIINMIIQTTIINMN